MDKVYKNDIVSLFKALGNPIRLDILHFLASGERCVCNIFDYLNLPQNLVSHHLGILRKNNLIESRKDGKWVHYSLDSKCFARLKDFVGNFVSAKNNKSYKC